MVETTTGIGTARISGVVRPRSAKLSRGTRRCTTRSASTSAPASSFLGVAELRFVPRPPFRLALREAQQILRMCYLPDIIHTDGRPAKDITRLTYRSRDTSIHYRPSRNKDCRNHRHCEFRRIVRQTARRCLACSRTSKT